MGREKRIIRELRQAGFTVLSRKQWGSRHRPLYQWRRIRRHFPREAKSFFAHVTVTNRSDSFAADIREVEQIGYERFKTGISYNYAVDQKTGAIAIGMPHDAAGAPPSSRSNASTAPRATTPRSIRTASSPGRSAR
jgi:hypothetical protein